MCFGYKQGLIRLGIDEGKYQKRKGRFASWVRSAGCGVAAAGMEGPNGGKNGRALPRIKWRKWNENGSIGVGVDESKVRGGSETTRAVDRAHKRRAFLRSCIPALLHSCGLRCPRTKESWLD